MNNDEFANLLNEKDVSLLKDTTKPKHTGKHPARANRQPKGGGGENKPDGRKFKQSSDGVQYRDRADERRQGKEEYKTVEEEFEKQAELSVEDSKYLGGDFQHTHMVKGLDFALLKKVRTELDHDQRMEAMVKQTKKKEDALAKLGPTAQQIYNNMASLLHPAHRLFPARVKEMGKRLAHGVKIKGGSQFQPGRMIFVFNVEMEAEGSEQPLVQYRAKEDCPKPLRGKAFAPIAPHVVQALSGLAEARKARRAAQRAKVDAKK